MKSNLSKIKKVDKVKTDKKLNNLIDYKDFKLDKLENKPGKKVVENLNNIQTFDNYIDEGIGSSIKKGLGIKSKEEKYEIVKDNILKHPIKSKIYLDLEKRDPEKARKYIEFFIKNPEGMPRWDSEKETWIDTARYSHELLGDIGAPRR